MKTNRVLGIALLAFGVTFALSIAAKTVVHLKDAQGKSVGTVVLYENKGGGVGLFTGCAAGDTGTAVVLSVTD